MSSKHVLVVGSSGFIGSHVMEAFDRDGLPSATGLDTVPSPWTRVVGSIQDMDVVNRLPKSVNEVHHIAAIANSDMSLTHPRDMIDANVQSVASSIAYAKHAGASRFVYSSSIWVFNSSPDAPSGAGSAFLPIIPASLYEVTKLCGEFVAMSLAGQYGMQCVILRYGIPYGPRQHPGSVVPAFLLKALNGEDLEVHGGGEAKRRLVFVGDLAYAHAMVTTRLPSDPERFIFQLDGYESFSIAELAAKIAAQYGVGVTHVGERTVDLNYTERKIETGGSNFHLNWRPSGLTSFDDGLKLTADWWRANRARYS